MYALPHVLVCQHTLADQKDGQWEYTRGIGTGCFQPPT
jgi:hypothetical protein